jgi:N-acetylmuramoyl-L-alanine amidase
MYSQSAYSSRRNDARNDGLNHDQGTHPGRSVIIAALIATGLMALGVPGRAVSAELKQIALDADPQGGTVLTLTLSTPVAQHVFRLQNPDRLVIDLPNTRRQVKLPLPPERGIVAGLRSGVSDAHVLRLVVELRAPMQPQVQPAASAAGYRLRIALAAEAPGTTEASVNTPPVGAPAVVATAAPTVVPAPTALPAPTATTKVPARSVRAAHAPHGEHDIIVAVDAGHGGDDPGATGASGTHEKVVTLAIARALAARIDREPGMHAVLTRDGDYFVDLRNRMVRAQAANANMFVSIHADAVRDRSVSGASVYTLSERGASSEAARQLAEHENAADLKGGLALADVRPDVRSVVLDVQQNANMGQSVEVADRVLGALDRVGAVRKREVQQAAFVVLKSPAMPSLLVETAYISNPDEERKLRTPAEQQRLAEAIFSGIDSYFRKFPPEGSQYARAPGAAADDSAELARAGF